MGMLKSSCSRFAKLMCLCVLATAAGCATYTTPGAGINVGNLSQADADIGELLAREPAATFPARLAVARVQASGYYSRSNNSCYGTGQFCVLSTRDIETDQEFERVAKLPLVTEVARMSRLLLPSKLDSTKELRRAAASLKTDLLLIYSALPEIVWVRLQGFLPFVRGGEVG